RRGTPPRQARRGAPSPGPARALAATVREHRSGLETNARAPSLSVRLLRGALLALVPLAVVYEIGMNAFLMTGALGRVVSFDPETFTVRYASAWSILPGYVHARDLFIRSKDGHVEFELRIDRCTFQAALLDLTRRKFTATTVRGEGVVFRARRRLAPEDATPGVLAALPPIEGLEAIPLLGPATPPPDDAHYKLWSVQLANVEARSVREIWIDEVRLVGDADVRGGFSLRPIRWVTVGPASVILRTGRVTRGDDALADTLTGTLDVTVDGFDPRAVEGAEVLRFLTVRSALHAAVPSFDFVGAFVDRPVTGAPPRFRGHGAAECDLTVRRGRLASPSHVELVADPFALDLEHRSVDAKLRAVADVAEVAGSDALDALVEAREVRLVEHRFEGSPLSAERAELRLRSRELDLAESPFRDATSSIAVPSVQIPDARVINAWSSAGGAPRVAAGRGTFGAHVDVADGLAHGNLVLGLDALRVTEQGGWSVAGNLRTQLSLRSWSLAPGTRGKMDWSGSHIELADVTTTGGTSGWWARIELPTAAVELHPSPRFRARVTVTARDARPLASLFAAKSGAPSWLVPLFSTDDLRAEADLHASPASVELRDLVATAGGFRVEAGWAKRGPRTHAVALIELGALGAALEAEDGDTRFQLLDAESWYRRHAAAASFTK
ncbi:MAG: hypothetical protein M3O36_12960, partial [Myxococcota bacterium]|nr:hypothetical protein [Myxococcota bacterium]